MENKKLISEKLRNSGILIDEEKEEKLFLFYRMVIEKNKVMNLTAITDYEEFIEKHFIDSLLLLRAMEPESSCRLLDIGTGAGFPGIPLKILNPEWEILLLDSLKKRLTFLDEVIKTLGLSKIGTVHCRAEELSAKGDYREGFDLVVSRAVSALPTLCEYCLPYVKQGGKFVAYKAVSAEEELSLSKNAIKILGGRLVENKHFMIEGTDYERNLIILEKVKETPVKYPRAGGKPLKNPLS